MKKSWFVLYVLIGILILLVVLPYANVEILSINADKKLEGFDLSCFDGIYGAGTPNVYDCKVYQYSKENSAEVLYVFGNCEFGVMVDLKWSSEEQCWVLVDGRNMWSVHGGSAQEFYWPFYYWDKALPWLSK